MFSLPSTPSFLLRDMHRAIEQERVMANLVSVMACFMPVQQARHYANEAAASNLLADARDHACTGYPFVLVCRASSVGYQAPAEPLDWRPTEAMPEDFYAI